MFIEEEFKELENELEILMEPAGTEEQDADEGILKCLLYLDLAFVIAVVGVRGFIWIFEFVLNRAG
ncbi:hypothetical protein IJL65_00435 [bacterium]|nr:hypothetical protein [bacterium]